MSPPMRTPRLGVSYSEALAAAYATAPEEEVIIDTLEFLHPLFQDETGTQIGIRIVNDHNVLHARLESSAPLNGGQYVDFSPCGFRFVRPEESDSGQVPEVEIQVDNVSRLLIPYVQLAMTNLDPIEVIWRPYCVSDLTGPHMNPVLRLTLHNVSADMYTVKARAGFTDLANRRFPSSEYTSKKFPGLTVR